MALVETPIRWLWLARGAEIFLNLSPGDFALVILDNHERSVGGGGRIPFKVPLVWISVQPGANPTVEGLITEKFVRLLERARAVPVPTPKLYGILKSKGTRGGVSSGASGAPLVDAAELGFVCLDQDLLDITGFTALSPGRVRELGLPGYIQEKTNEPEPEVPRVSRYERKWVI
jgi:hypothetical protein